MRTTKVESKKESIEPTKETTPAPNKKEINYYKNRGYSEKTEEFWVKLKVDSEKYITHPRTLKETYKIVKRPKFNIKEAYEIEKSKSRNRKVYNDLHEEEEILEEDHYVQDALTQKEKMKRFKDRLASFNKEKEKEQDKEKKQREQQEQKEDKKESIEKIENTELENEELDNGELGKLELGKEALELIEHEKEKLRKKEVNKDQIDVKEINKNDKTWKQFEAELLKNEAEKLEKMQKVKKIGILAPRKNFGEQER